MKKLIVVMLIMMFLIESCRIYSNERLIEYFTEELELYRDRYEELVDIVNTTKTANKRYRIQYVSNLEPHLQLAEYEQLDSTFVDDFEFPQSMRFFWGEREITGLSVEVKEEFSISYLGISNKNRNDVYLVYLFGGFEKQREYYQNKGFKICKNGEIPEDYSNWIYLLDENWVILSPKKSFP